MRKVFGFILLILLAAPTLYAGGFQVALHGTKQIGMGHVGTGLMLDASAALYNPGGMAFIERTNFYASVHPLFANLAFREGGFGQYTETVAGKNFPFSVYFTHKGKPDSRWTFGLAVYTPFGLSIDWPEQWKGRYVVQSSAISTIFIQPTVGFKVNDKVGIGIGPSFVYGMLNLKQALPLTNANGQDGQIKMDATAMWFGLNVGIYYKPSDKLSFGVSYRMPAALKFKGQANLTVPQSVNDLFPSQTNFSTTVNIPQTAGVGVGFYPTKRLTFGLEVNYTGWNTYDTLRLDFEKNTPVFADQKLPRNYKQSFAFRLGGQFQVNKFMWVRLGALYDLTPIPDKSLSPELPDGNLLGFTGGLGFKLLNENLHLDLAFQYVKVASREATLQGSNFTGQYNAQLFIPSLSVQYSFGKKAADMPKPAAPTEVDKL